ncbi:MAG: homoserine O-succinyltransferase [Dysgonamonadaceae bacterium]|jgi:homoserine O-succinyltransferase|nr:homoserine O-succinyltransferase [Dysgonamonadaceae bacterium]
MLINLPDNLPSVEILKGENIFPCAGSLSSASRLRIALLNLMPLKTETEVDFLRLMAHSPVATEVTFVRLRTHRSKNTPQEHLDKFYRYFDEIRGEHFDGMIITGAPVELLDFRDVTYWEELTAIFDWAGSEVASTIYICWAAQAALYHFYGVDKHPLPEKLSGVFLHTVNQSLPLFCGFDDEFYAPHSRHTGIDREDILRTDGLVLVSESAEAGVYAVIARGGREIFITGHPEYSPLTLHNEYVRDLAKGLPAGIPVNYYRSGAAADRICVRWRAHAEILFSNWLNYYLFRASGR